MAKRRRPSEAETSVMNSGKDASTRHNTTLSKQASKRRRSQPNPAEVDADPNINDKILDGLEALRASPDADDGHIVPASQMRRGKAAARNPPTKQMTSKKSDGSSSSELSDAPESSPSRLQKKKPPGGTISDTLLDPEADSNDVAEDPEELSAALNRPPPVNSSYLPLPWKGRLGYACLNTYLRSANPPVFSSRTCRIASILENRHPLKDPTQPAHATKNRPDKEQPADVARGQAFVEGLGLANARDIPKMLRWNERYGIKFLRLSSEMFPFASHDVYGYNLAPFASEALAEAGRVAAQFGHRLTTHPGQFTQLGSPRKEVIKASIRDLEYHAELLSLLKLPEQLNKDAVMILHMGGIFGDKAATIDRFRKNYAQLDTAIKNRLVLENDDVCYSVHDLLPVCEDLNIPFVLDYHHHNIVFDADKIREGTADIMELYPRILATWSRKGITPKMHYSEPTPAAITGRQRRKHNPRPATLPPCPPDMDLMIEAKDKEQAVFELMRTFKLPSFDTFSDITPHVREDENKPWKPPPAKKKKTPKKGAKKEADEDLNGLPDVEDDRPQPPLPVPPEDVSLGGPLGRVYWPPGMEEWLRPKKREIKKKAPEADEENGKVLPVKDGTTAVSSKKKKNKKTSALANGNVDEELEPKAKVEAEVDDSTQINGEEDIQGDNVPTKSKSKSTLNKNAKTKVAAAAAAAATTHKPPPKTTTTSAAAAAATPITSRTTARPQRSNQAREISTSARVVPTAHASNNKENGGEDEEEKEGAKQNKSSTSRTASSSKRKASALLSSSSSSSLSASKASKMKKEKQEKKEEEEGEAKPTKIRDEVTGRNGRRVSERNMKRGSLVS